MKFMTITQVEVHYFSHSVKLYHTIHTYIFPLLPWLIRVSSKSSYELHSSHETLN